MLSLTRAEQKTAIEKPEVTKLEVVNLGEADVNSDSELPDVQRKRDSGYAYNRPNRVTSRFRIQAHQSRSQVASKLSGQLGKPFTTYGPPSHSPSGPTVHRYRAQQHRNKLQHQQQPISFNDELVEQEVPSPIRNVDFAEANPIASQNNEPFGMHTANYLPPQNQKLPAYSSTDNFTPQTHSPQNSLGHGQFEDTSLQNQNFAQSQNQQISDAALFLSENAHAIQQLYGASASNQDFAPGNDQFPNIGNQNSNSQFGKFESTSQSPQGFRGALPSYASGTLNSQETLEQVQSLEKDRLIVQLQQALAEAQTTPSTDAAGRYAQNDAGFIQNQDLLASINQQIKTNVPTTPQTFGSGSTVFTQSPFLPGTTVNPLGFPLSYGIPTTAQTPITTTTTAAEMPTVQPPQSSKGDGSTQVMSSQPASNQPASPTAVSPVGIPVYGGFVPSFIAGTNLVPSYSTSIFASGPIKPVQSSGSSPTHFGIPIPTEPPQKPVYGSIPSTPAATTPSPASSNQPQLPGVALTPAITPIALPVQPIRPVAASLHPLATPVHPVALHPVLPVNPTQVYPVQTAPAVSSSVQHTYGVQTALINPVLYKPVKAVYPVYYYTNIAHQLQKPALPSNPWSYAPSYAQTKPAQIWK